MALQTRTTPDWNAVPHDPSLSHTMRAFLEWLRNKHVKSSSEITTLQTTVSGISDSMGTPPDAPVIPDPEIPSGTINGSNTIFTITSSVKGFLVLNGLYQREGTDYTRSTDGYTITYTNAPQGAGSDTTADWHVFQYV